MPHATSPARPFGTVLTAMVTPMDAAGAVDLDAAARLARHLADHGHDGIVVNGTTGESPTTHAPEKSDLVRTVVEAVGDRVVVVAGAGSNDTSHAIRMAQQAQEAGANGLLVVSPYYSRPSQAGIVTHTLAVAEATSLPVMLYDVPGRTGVRLSAATLDRLAAHEQIVAMKDATGDVAGAAHSIQRTGLAWYSGDDAVFLPLLAQGAVGVVSVVGHVAGLQLAEIARAFAAGDNARALEVFRAIGPAIRAMNGAGFQAVMAKAAIEILGITTNRELRLPNVAATDGEALEVRAGLVAAGLVSAVGSPER